MLAVDDANNNNNNSGSCNNNNYIEDNIEDNDNDSNSNNNSTHYPPRSFDDFLEAAAAAAYCGTAAATTTNNNNKNNNNDPFRNNKNNNNANNNTTSFIRIIWRIPYSVWLIFLSLGIANSSDATEILCISYILTDTNFDNRMLLTVQPWRGSLLAAAVFMGMLLGGLLVGTVGDYHGRKPILLIGLCMNCIVGICSAFTFDIFSLSFFRFISGIGIGTTVPPIFTLCSELSPSSLRGFWITIISSFWMVGSIFVAIVGWYYFAYLSKTTTTTQDDDNDNNSLLLVVGVVASWRLFAITCAIPSGIGFLLVYKIVPESPRFLILQCRDDEAVQATQVLANAYMMKNNNNSNNNTRGPPPPAIITREELIYHHHQQQQQQQSPIYYNNNNQNLSNNNVVVYDPLQQQQQHQSIPIVQQQQQQQSRSLSSLSLSSFCTFWKTSIGDFYMSARQLYTTPALWKITYPLQLLWFTLSFGTYGLLTWINKLFIEVHLENVYCNALLFALSNLPGNIIAAILMDRIGRNGLLSSSLVGAAFSLLAFAYVAAMNAKYNQYNNNTQMDNNNNNSYEDYYHSDTTTTTTTDTDYYYDFNNNNNNNETNNNINGGNNDDGDTDDDIVPIAKGWIVLAACLFQCFTIVAWDAIDVVTSELYPTIVRATGMGLCSAYGRMGAMIAQLINGFLLERPAALLMTAAITLLMGSITPTFLLPKDITGQPVQDHVVVVDDDHDHDLYNNNNIISSSGSNNNNGAVQVQQQQQYEISSSNRPSPQTTTTTTDESSRLFHHHHQTTTRTSSCNNNNVI